MEKNVLEKAKQLFDEKKAAEAYEICNDYLKNNGNDDTLSLEEKEELALLRISCVIKTINLLEFYTTTTDDDEGFQVLACDRYEDMAEVLKLDILDLLRFMADTESESIKKSKLEYYYKQIAIAVRDHYNYYSDIALQFVDKSLQFTNDTYEIDTQPLKDCLRYYQGYTWLLQYIMYTFALLKNNAQVDDMDYVKYYEEDMAILRDRFYEKSVSIIGQISESTNDYPYFDETVAISVCKAFGYARALIEQSLPEKNDANTEEGKKRIFRLKQLINVDCDYLNSMAVKNGQRFSIIKGAERDECYNDIIEYEKEVKEYEGGYSHPSVNREAFSTLNDKAGGCYVATCVYGSYDCPQVWTLRRFRDYTLAETWYGRTFIKTYYAISPTLVKWFGDTNWFKNMWKGKLDRMVRRLNDKGIEDTEYRDIN